MMPWASKIEEGVFGVLKVRKGDEENVNSGCVREEEERETGRKDQ